MLPFQGEWVCGIFSTQCDALGYHIAWLPATNKLQNTDYYENKPLLKRNSG